MLLHSCGCHIEDSSHSSKITVVLLLEALSPELFSCYAPQAGDLETAWHSQEDHRQKSSGQRTESQQSLLHTAWHTWKDFMPTKNVCIRLRSLKFIQQSFVSAASHWSDTDMVYPSPKPNSSVKKTIHEQRVQLNSIHCFLGSLQQIAFIRTVECSQCYYSYALQNSPQKH